MGKVFIGNFKGPKGDTGPQGKQGIQGIPGPAGPTGTVDTDTPVDFTEASALENIESGESLSAIFGKIRKIAGSLLIGAGSTLLGQNLAAARALVSDVNGKVGTSTITAAELGYLAGLTKNAQSQFNELNENFASSMKNAINIDTISPGVYWINGYNTEHTGAVPFTSVHYVLIGRGTTGQCDTQIAFPYKNDKIKIRHRDSILSAWGAWIDQINLPSFNWGFIDDLNNFKQFSDSPKMMFGYGTGYNGSTKNTPINCAFCVLYIPYGGSNYGEQLLFSVQQVHGSYPIYKRTLENGSWSYWENISCPCNNYIYNGQQDWDGYLAVGLYSISFLTGHNSPSGPGVGQWGYLDVKPWGDYGANGCLQRYYSTAGKAVYRIKFDGNWSNWFALN